MKSKETSYSTAISLIMWSGILIIGDSWSIAGDRFSRRQYSFSSIIIQAGSQWRAKNHHLLQQQEWQKTVIHLPSSRSRSTRPWIEYCFAAWRSPWIA